MEVEADVVILGGGIGGLWVLYELAKHGYSCVLIDSNNLGYFASTHNQSWLHTGALYQIIASVNPSQRPGLWRMVDMCRQGTHLIKEFCSVNENATDAIENTPECMFLFGAGDQSIKDKAERDLIYRGFDIYSMEKKDFQIEEPILEPIKDGLLEYCLTTDDAPFDAYKILSALKKEIFGSNGNRNENVMFHRSTTHLDELEDILPYHDKWRIKDGSFTVDAHAVICTAGVLNPWIFNRITNSIDFGGMTIQNCLVLVLNQRICNRIIVIRNLASQLINLVPFSGGTTINLGNLDKTTNSFTNLEPSQVFDDEDFATMSEALGSFLPGLRNVSGSEIHFYVCQKLNNTQQSNYPLFANARRHYFWIERRRQAPNFFFLYPGKFTLAPIVAQEISLSLYDRVKPTNQTLPEKDTPTIATSPYKNKPTHLIRVTKQGEVNFQRKS